MEQQTQSEYTIIRRTAAVPVSHEEPPADGPAKADKPKVRRTLTGEGKLLLMQTVAGLLMLLAVALGAALGGDGFREWYRSWMAWRSVDLPSLIEPIAPESLPMPESDGAASM